MRKPVALCVVAACAVLIFAGLCRAQSDARPGGEGPASDGVTPAPPDLAQLQQQLQKDYERFEKDLFELGERSRRTDPGRADLLTRARGQSRELRILQEMAAIAELLQKGEELGDAAARQEDLVAHLQVLLKLLQSEDERDRISREIARIEDLLKDTNKVIGRQKDVRADTERGRDAGKLEGDQQNVAGDAQKLADKIDRQDAERAAESSSKGGSGSDSGSQPGEQGQKGEPGTEPDGQPAEKRQDPAEGERSKTLPDEKGEPGTEPDARPEPGTESQSPGSKPQPAPGSQSQQSQGSQSPRSQGQQSQGQQSQGQQNQGQQSQGQNSHPPGKQQESQGEQSPPDRTPGREELEQALEEMNRAIEELRKKDHDKASDEQDEALARLEEMKARLEEILRQLREEERELFLTMLEARFQNMLRLQLQINAETVRLDKTPAEQREARHFNKATQLSRDQRDNALDADKALVLLKEEASSVAFPEAVEQMRDNMLIVSRRLEQAETAETTQLVERIIVETLEEMILALQKELEKMKDREQQPPQDQQQQEEDPALVDVLAELKMVRSLQNQVNRLTKQLGLSIEGEQAAEPDTLNLLLDLSRRQQRIQEATYDLSTGKTALGQKLREAGR